MVQNRAVLGSAESRRLRRQGLIPGILYGREQPVAISIAERDLRAALTTRGGLNAVLDVVVEGGKMHSSVLKEYQQDPVRGLITHVDLQEVRLDQPIHATVPLHLHGEPVGVKEGGVLSQVTNELNVEALPMEVPEHLEADVSEMHIGDTLRLSALTAPEGVTLLDDLEETVLATVTQPTRDEEPEPVEGEEGEEGAEGETAEGETAEGAAAAATAPTPAPPRTSPGHAALAAAARHLARPARRGASATRAASTRATATTSAGWSSTSSRGGTTVAWRAKFSGQLAEVRIDGHKVALLKPETFMNDSGRVGAGGAAVLQARAGRGARRPRRERPRARPAPGPDRRRRRRATTACARSPSTSARRSSCGCGSAWGGPGAAIRARSPTCALRLRPRRGRG